LRLDGHGYSPAVLATILEAAGRLTSAQQAAIALQVCAGLDISSRHVSRLIRAFGAELAEVRDTKTAQRRRRQAPQATTEPPTVVAVEVDGGRLWTRQTQSGPGVHGSAVKEDKIACLQSLDSDTHPEDPQPEPPPSFLDAPRVARLVQRLKGQSTEASAAAAAVSSAEPTPPAAEATAPQAQPLPQPEPWAGAPTRLLRTCVATMQNSKAFGAMVAGEAHARRFYEAARRGFLGDGQAYNWKIHRAYFWDFVAIVDFIHVLCYLYLGSWAAGGDEATCWERYRGWVRWCWQGRVGEVIEELCVWQERLGRPPPGEEVEEKDPRKVVGETLRYLRNNRERMDYPSYRQQGLPVTSSLVESLVGEFNSRVKGKDKHWDRPEGAEAILQLRAAVLSQDGRLGRFFADRPGNPYRRHRRSA
jgi:hypothetical protein